MSRTALITAFATGNLFVVLAVLMENCRQLFREYGLEKEETDFYIGILVPVSFNFPNIGKLLMLVFIPFAGWYSGNDMASSDYPTFVIAGLLSFFGGVDVAMPFMLDLMQIPVDLYQLYLVTGVVNGRSATLLAAMNLIVFTTLATAILTGTYRLNRKRLLSYVSISLVLLIGMLAGLRLHFQYNIEYEYAADRAFEEMHLLDQPVKSRDVVYSKVTPEPPAPGQSGLERIRQRGFLRVGYLPDSLPYAYRNREAAIVGFDAEMAHDLARNLGVELEFVRLDRKSYLDQLQAGYSDILMSAIPVTPHAAGRVSFSQPHSNETIAFIVKDHRRDDFRNWDLIRNMEKLRVGLVMEPFDDLDYYENEVRQHLNNASIQPLESPRTFFREHTDSLDALIHTAEGGGAWTVLYPDFTVVIPKPTLLSVPLAYAVAKQNKDLLDFVNAWISLKKGDGMIKRFFNHWILGQGAAAREPRWSVLRNVLGWGR